MCSVLGMRPCAGDHASHPQPGLGQAATARRGEKTRADERRNRAAERLPRRGTAACLPPGSVLANTSCAAPVVARTPDQIQFVENIRNPRHHLTHRLLRWFLTGTPYGAMQPGHTRCTTRKKSTTAPSAQPRVLPASR